MNLLDESGDWINVMKLIKKINKGALLGSALILQLSINFFDAY